MTFLNPWTGLLAAAVAVPLLLLLYFLRLRRHLTRMASTMLWRRAVEDLQANVPFQRLRRSLLLLLQLLLVGLLAAALARPVVRGGAAASSRVILLIDRSASMSATDADGRSRLAAARDAAGEAVRRLLRRGRPVEIMVVAFADRPAVVRGFDGNRRLLLEAIDGIEATDAEADLVAALDLAGAFARRDESADEPPPEVVLFSDGGVAPPPQPGGFRLASGTLRLVAVGPPGPADVSNVGIVAFSARRDYEQPSRALLFSRLINAGPQPVTTAVTLRVDGEPAAVEQIEIPAAGPDGPGEAPFTTAVEVPGTATLMLTCAHDDALAADDAAALVLRAPAAPRIALVHGGDAPDPFLVSLLESVEPRRLLVLGAPRRPEAAPPFAARDVDVAVLDRWSPPRLPPVPSLGFGAAPGDVAGRPPSSPGGARVLSWDRHHPLLRHVSLDGVVYREFGGYDLPEPWTPLALGPEGPVIAARGRGTTRHVLVGFALADSTWPMQVSLTVFAQNVLEYLFPAAGGEADLVFRPGEPVTVPTRPGAQTLEVAGPVTLAVEAAGGPETTLPPLRRVGVYRVEGAVAPFGRIAVSLLSDVESDLRPRRSLVVNAQTAEATAPEGAAPLELWPWLGVVALILLLVEWLVYCARARG